MTTREFLKKLTPSPVTAILIGLIVYLWFRPPAFVDELRQPAPDLPELSALRGQVVLVNFWATWCPYCRHEMPAMEAYYREHKARGFEIVAYSLDKTQQEVDVFMRQEGYTFPAPLASPGVDAAFGGVSRLPTSFVIDRQGRIRHKVSGQVHKGRLEDLINPL
ncbi:MAG: TlpA family protein disulfide reductase, partial [Thiobacillaceae bacterium]|nr:TlpA family protein disulfide reductase [Thiobacillaceae bacterium]